MAWNPQWWSNPVLSGELKKRGALKQWKAVFCILQNDKLFYFKNKAEKLPEGCIVLKGSFVAPTKKVKQPFAFEVTDSRDNKVHFLHTGTKAELDAWVDALEKAAKHNPVCAIINIKHTVHVNYDTEKGTFSGLPRDWADLLQQNGITADAYASKQEAERNSCSCQRYTCRKPVGGSSYSK